MMMIAKVQSILAELNKRMEVVYGPRLTKLLLYGSHARGDAEPGSDVDVLVVLKGDLDPALEIERTGEIVADISLKHEEVISCVFIDENKFINRNGPFLRNIRKEGVVVA